MPAAGLADRHGIEISALQEHVLRAFRHTALQSSEHTGDTHRFLFIGDHQVAGIHLTLDTVQGDEFLALLGITHVDLIAFDLVRVKSMQRLTALVQHEVRYIDDIVDWSETDSQQTVLQPFRTLLDLHTFDAHARVTRTSLRRIHEDVNF